VLSDWTPKMKSSHPYFPIGEREDAGLSAA